MLLHSVAVTPWLSTANLPTAMQITAVPQRMGMGTRPHAYPQHYRGHPRPPLFLPGIQPQSQLSSLSYGWCGLAFSTHLGTRGSKHCLLGFSLYTPRLGHPQVNYSMGPGITGQDSARMQGADVQSPDNHIPQAQTHLTNPQKMLPSHSETRSSPCAGSNISTVLTKWGRE